MTRSPSPEFLEIPISIGERIVGQATLTTAEIAAFARMCGDPNPLHHDEAYARDSLWRDHRVRASPHLSDHGSSRDLLLAKSVH
jgi:acyl dehydratase